ncbi:MAG: DEAD/DEAH box helicase [Thermoleophilia bacterium]|nr:DEAD/DEAH box helicase [Thermoleophilia bacterium]
MARTIRLRKWQKAALDAFLARASPDFLAVATPGAGKTRFALAAGRQTLAATPGRLVIVAPTQHLKHQWADAAEELDLHLETAWSAADGGLPPDVHGVVTTYQQVAGSAEALAPIADGAFVILDEVHHAGDDRAWGDAVRVAFEGAAARLSLSGTPFRSDTRAIPFVAYDDDGMASPDVEYGYDDALHTGGVVRPVHFPRIDGEMEWIASDGTAAAASFADHLDAPGTAQRLRTALSVDGEWMPHVLRLAHERLMLIRRTQPDAGGLVIATDQGHARGIAALMARMGVDAVVAVSEDAEASRRIGAFAAGTAPWIVAVRMVSEGVDIPRLRVGVFATTTTTELFFRQAVGRIVRWIRGLGPQPAYMFIPDDPRLRTHAWNIAEQRRHSLRRRDDDGMPEDADPAALDEPPREPRDEPQLSLFAALSATPMGDPTADGQMVLGAAVAEAPADEEADGVEWDLELVDAPPLEAPPSGKGLSRREYRRILRDSNSSAVRLIARATGLSHAAVNSELNRRVGVQRVQEATLGQLEERRAQAERWLARPTG